MKSKKRLIDVNAVIKEIDNYYHNSPFPHPGTTWLRGLELAVGLLLREPTVDAVEVVRCKDCKYYFHYGCITECSHPEMCSDDRDAFLNVLPDDFCSRGERKQLEE